MADSLILLYDLSPGTTYHLQVRPSGSTGDFGPVFTFTTPGDGTGPGAVTGLTFVSIGTSFTGVWSAPALDGDGGTLKDLQDYKVTITAGASSVVYYTTSTRFDFTLEMNRAAFGTPKGSLQITVQARDTTGNLSSPATATASNPPPAALTGVSATGINEGISAKWDASADTDIDHYELYMGTPGFTADSSTFQFSTNSTSAILPTGTNYTLHEVAVGAVDVFGTLGTLVRVQATPISSFTADVTAPSSVNTLTVTGAADPADPTQSNIIATATWTKTTVEGDLAGFSIRYKKSTDSNYNYVDVSDSTARTAIIPGLSPGVIYNFGILAYDFSTNKSGWTTANMAAVADTTAPSSPTGVTLNAGITTVIIAWTENTEIDVKNGAGTYEVQIATNSGFTTGVQTNKTTATVTSFAGLTAGTTYWARVRAVDSSGNPSAYTASTPTSITAGSSPTTPLSDGSAPASSPTPTVSGGLGDLMVTWTAIANADAVTYEVHLSTSTGFTPSGATKCDEVSGTFSTIRNLPGTTTPLSYGTTYFVKLIAKDRDGSAAAGSQGSGQIAAVASGDITSVSGAKIHDGTPPASSPTPTVRSGIGYLFAFWTAIANNDPVTYEVHVSTTTGFTPSGATKAFETSDLSAVIKTDGAGTALAYGTTYFIKLIAKDLDGSAAAGTQASGAISQVTAGDVTTISGTQVHDGSAPASSPTPTVKSGLGFLVAYWTPVANNDPVTYEVHISPTTGFTPSGATKVLETTDTYVSIRNDAAGTLLAYGTTYFIKLIAKDLDGSAAAGTQASGSISQVGTADITTISGSQVHDGSPPASSPTPTIIAGVGYLLAYWTATTNNDPVVYDVHISTTTGFTPSGATRVTTVSDTNTVIRNDASGVALVYGTTYFVKIVSRDADGSAAAGTQASGVPVQAATGDIAVNAITTNLLAANAVTAAKIAANTITAAQIAADTITATEIAASAITASELAANSVYTNALQANVVTAAKIAANTITAAQIAAGTITTTELAALTIVAGNIAAGTITGAKIAANTIAAGNIVADTLTSTEIAANAITTSELNAGAVTAAKIAANTITAAQIAAGTITATQIAAGTITGDRIFAATITGDLIAANTIDAASLKANTIIGQNLTVGSTLTMNASGIMSSSNWSAGTAGWRLTNTSLEINQGSIAAASLILQIGSNLVPAEYADFEFPATFYTSSTLTLTNAPTLSIVTSNNKYGTQALQFVGGVSAPTVVFGPSATFNIPVDSSTPYISSIYVFQNSGVSKNYNLTFLDNGTGSTTLTSGALAVPSGVLTRISAVFTSAASANKAVVGITGPVSTTSVVDGLQVEKQTSTATTPSQWRPPSTTTINGGIIRTGSIQSQTTVTYGGITQPNWLINTQGGAVFADVLVKGHVIIGDGSGTTGDQYISAYNYSAGSAGWIIKADGSVEFNNGSFKGNLQVGSTVPASTVSGTVPSATSSSNLTGGTISGTNTISGLLTVGSPAAAHVEVGTNGSGDTGFRMYASNGTTKLVEFNSATGAVNITGNVTITGGSVPGSTVTGTVPNASTAGSASTATTSTNLSGGGSIGSGATVINGYLLVGTAGNTRAEVGTGPDGRSGIRLYLGTNTVPTVDLSVSSGSGTFVGDLTGSTLATATGGQRVVIAPAGGYGNTVQLWGGGVGETGPATIYGGNSLLFGDILGLSSPTTTGTNASTPGGMVIAPGSPSYPNGIIYTGASALRTDSILEVNGSITGSVTIVSPTISSPSITANMNLNGNPINGVGQLNNAGGTITMNAGLSMSGTLTMNNNPINNVTQLNNGGGAISMSGSLTASGTITTSGGDVTASTTVTCLSPPTTSTAANVWMNTSTGRLNKVVASSLRFKQNVKSLSVNEARTLVLNLRPVSYKYKRDYFEPRDTFWGLIAEEVHGLGQRQFVGYEDGTDIPEDVNYSRLVAPLLVMVQDLWKRVSELEAGLAATPELTVPKG